MRYAFTIIFLTILFLFLTEVVQTSAKIPFYNEKQSLLSSYQIHGPVGCSESTISIRKSYVLKKAAENVLSRNLLNDAVGLKAGQLDGKHLIPFACAVLENYPENKLAKEVILNSMRYRNRDNMFTKMRAAQAFFQFKALFTEDEKAQFEKEMTTHSGFFGYGTENHITMKRVAALLFGESFPDVEFAHSLTGKEVKDECMTYVQRYGRAVYGSSNSEFLSHIYFPVHMEAWATAWQYTDDPKVSLMARAILDWFFANAALNYHHGFMNGPLQRAAYAGIERYEKNALSMTMWLFGADRKEMNMEVIPSSIISLAMTGYLPHKAIRNILTGKVNLPYTIEQACTNKSYIAEFYQNNISDEKTKWEFPHQKFLFRNVYIHSLYAMGGGNQRIALEEFISSPTAISFTASWQSEHKYNYLMATHPYWFTKKKWGEEESRWGFGDNINNKEQVEGTFFLDNDLFGFSPFLQMVQKENAAVLIYNIPQIDPFRDYNQKGGSASDRLENLIQECFVYLPNTVEERTNKMDMFFVRAGDCYIAILPFSPNAEWKESLRKGFFRIGIPGELTGFAIEIGDQGEYGSFEDFQKKFSKDQLNLQQLSKYHLVKYTSSRGHSLSIRHTGLDTGLPQASVQGDPIVWKDFPTLQSPYVTAAEHVLSINDGRSGFSVDWSKKYPSYSYYRIIEKEKIIYRKIWVEDGEVREWREHE